MVFGASCASTYVHDPLYQCSRYTPSAEEYWTPSKEEIFQLETNFEKLASLESNRCCNSGRIEGSPLDYFRRYHGIVIGGKKYIYVNASSRPINEMEMFCDGGKAHWGVLYDPETKTFSNLAFNGEA